MKAAWNGQIVAESDATVVVDGNHYFPPSSLRPEHFRTSNLHTVCGWKGTADYFDLVVGEDVNVNAAWTYPTPKPAAEQSRGYVAFYRNRVQITE